MRLPTAEEVFSKASLSLRSTIKDIVNIKTSLEQQPFKSLITHATTCLGIVFDKGVLVASDGQATTIDHKIVASSFEKIIKLDRSSLLAISGVPGLAIKMGKILGAQFSFDADRNEGSYIPPKSKASVIADMIQRNMSLAFAYQLVVVPIFATYDDDPRDQAGRVFSIWPDGTVAPESEFECIGSGGLEASNTISVLLDLKRVPARRLSLEETELIAAEALIRASKADSATGQYIYMKYILADGIHDVPLSEILLMQKSFRERRKK